MVHVIYVIGTSLFHAIGKYVCCSRDFTFSSLFFFFLENEIPFLHFLLGYVIFLFPFDWYFFFFIMIQSADMLSDLKAQAEALVLYANNIGGLLTCALRPSNVFGPGDTQLVPFLVNLARSGWAKV